MHDKLYVSTTVNALVSFVRTETTNIESVSGIMNTDDKVVVQSPITIQLIDQPVQVQSITCTFNMILNFNIGFSLVTVSVHCGFVLIKLKF